jgi:hypothetical protein
MPRLNGDSSNSGMVLLTVLGLALIVFGILEYQGVIDVLAFFGR